VALMSNEHRFAIGAGILIAPLFAGLVAFLADWALASEPGKLSHRRRQGLAVLTVIGGLVLAYLVLDLSRETMAAEGLLVLVAVLLALQFLKREPEIRHSFLERLVIFLSVLVAAGIGAVLAEAKSSPSFDDVSITVHGDGGPIAGGYVTSTDHVVVVATKCDVIEAVPRTEITRITVGPGQFDC
jgi:energy-converting hydrogenase Eha subunit A